MTPIHDEWAEVLNDIAGTHAFSLAGLALAREHYMPLAENAPDPERDLIWVQGFSPKDPDKFGYMKWKIKTIPERLAQDGPVAQRIGQQWAVLVHTQWEHNFRPRFAEAADIEKNDVKEPLMADIGRMRNDIIHHHGKATKKNCGRCEVLKWFQPGRHDPDHQQRGGRVHAAGRCDHDAGRRTWGPDPRARGPVQPGLRP